jgi:hypothetical protein
LSFVQILNDIAIDQFSLNYKLSKFFLKKGARRLR